MCWQMYHSIPSDRVIPDQLHSCNTTSENPFVDQLWSALITLIRADQRWSISWVLIKVPRWSKMDQYWTRAEHKALSISWSILPEHNFCRRQQNGSIPTLRQKSILRSISISIFLWPSRLILINIRCSGFGTVLTRFWHGLPGTVLVWHDLTRY